MNKEKVKKILGYAVILIISIYLLAGMYSFVFEQDELTVDKYNFQQLKKVKNTLNNLQNFKYNFENLKDLNEKYNLDIKPIKNCYFTQSHNGNYLYIFGFKIESLLYKLRYFNWYYVFPRYDLPYDNFCYGGDTCDDSNKVDFEYTISNPCEN